MDILACMEYSMQMVTKSVNHWQYIGIAYSKHTASYSYFGFLVVYLLIEVGYNLINCSEVHVYSISLIQF